jgi:hypothetical protein
MEVSMNDIDLEDETFQIRTGEVDESEPDIVRWMGTVNPPLLVLKSDGGGYRVVTGLEKIASLRALGSETIMARVMEPDAFEPVDLMEVVIRDRQARGPLNPVEASRALIRLKEMGVPESELCDRFLPLMGLRGDTRTLDRYLSLDDLPGDIVELISRGEIGIDSLERVTRRFRGEETPRVLRLIRDLKLGVNRQREAIALLAEIASRDQVTVSKILDREEIASTLDDTETNLPQRSQRFIAALRRIRAPETMAFLDEVKARIRELDLDPAVTLELSPYLEEKLVRVSFTFRTPDEFRELVEHLAVLGDGEALDRLVEDLFERERSEGE